MRACRVLASFLLVAGLTSCKSHPRPVERRVYVAATAATGARPSREQWEQEKTRVQARLDALGIGATVSVSAEALDVMLPALSPEAAASVADALTRVGKLEFLPALRQALPPEAAGAGVEIKRDSWMVPTHAEESDYLFSADRDLLRKAAGDDALLQKVPGGWRSWRADRHGGLSEPVVVKAEKEQDQAGKFLVSLVFDAASGTRFEEATGACLGRPLLIVLDGEVMSAPIVMDKISGGRAQISLGGMGKAANDQKREADELALVLRTGALNFPLELQDVLKL
jgi:preprotein translocase subunit SecD